MRIVSLLILLSVTPILAFSAGVESLSGRNCQVSTPPDTSGETLVHGLLLKVFPRKSAVPLDYSGCQTTWLRDEQGKWLRVYVMRFSKGKLDTWWSARDDEPSGRLCRFTNGTLNPKQPEECYEPGDTGLGSSFAPGCGEAAIKTRPMTSECIRSMD